MSLANTFRAIANRIKSPKRPSEEPTATVASARINAAPEPESVSALIQFSAITVIWNGAGGKITHLPAITYLWHSGTICNMENIDDGKALWCTKSLDEADAYDRWAREESRIFGRSAVRLQLETLQEMKMADFGGESLSRFTFEHCNDKHGVMKEALGRWCLEHGFDGAVNVNRGTNEVVICRPRQSLKIVTSKLL